MVDEVDVLGEGGCKWVVPLAVDSAMYSDGPEEASSGEGLPRSTCTVWLWLGDGGGTVITE